MNKNASLILAAIIAFGLTLRCGNETKPEKTDNQDSITKLDTKILAPNRIDPIEAMNNPSKHAWDLFLLVNHPAKDFKKERGIPDSNKKIGDPGYALWETWKNANEVFLDDGQEPPVWNDYSLDPYLSGKQLILEGSTAQLLRDINSAKSKDSIGELEHRFALNPQIFLDPDGHFEDGAGGETRMNKSTFDFIVKHELYNLDGQYKFREDYLKTGGQNPMSFDMESMEVKAMWKKLSKEELQNNIDKKYYVAIDSNGDKFGLVSLHIITKEIPNWFWCTFRHKDGPAPEIPSVDGYGQPNILKGTFWENYELSGTQTSYTDARGKDIKLSDPITESGFEQSSCMSCHALSVIGPGAMPQEPDPITKNGRMLFLRPEAYPPGRKNMETYGTPLEKIFFDEKGKEKFVQLDFLYSLAFRAKKKKGS